MSIIEIKNVSKKYNIGSSQSNKYSKSLKEGINDLFRKKIKQTEFYALKNITLDIKKGEKIGIIGHNGAGKSTLLKILSRITLPTNGMITVKGRVASLLEVGTGFHPELSGRENIYLNGSILGMSRKEISARFDEIVEFSDISTFLDTPVKRYSSGMYVRLAFSIAAHLESDVLIVDEVLAVGDTAFQNKCLGKMKDVSEGGKTVIFVSHNMQMIQQMCDIGIHLKKGELDFIGNISEATKKYLYTSEYKSEYFLFGDDKKLKNKEIQINILNHLYENSDVIKVGEAWKLVIRFTLNENVDNFIIAVGVDSFLNVAVNTTWSTPHNLKFGEYSAIFDMSHLSFSTGSYKIIIGMSSNNINFFYDDSTVSFQISEILDSNFNKNILKTTHHSGIVLNQGIVKINKNRIMLLNVLDYFLIIGVPFLWYKGNRKQLLNIMYFILPIEFYSPVVNTFNINLGVSLNSVFIWIIAFLLFSDKNSNDIYSKRLTKFYNAFLSFVGVILILITISLWNIENIAYLDKYTIFKLKIDVYQQIINSSIWYFTALLLAYILVKKIQTINDIRNAIFYFSLGILPYLFANTFGFFPLARITNNIINLDEISYSRKSGISIDYELVVDYCMIVIGFSIILFKKNKVISSLLLFSSLIVGIQTGTRSFLFCILIFAIVFFFSKISVKNLILYIFSFFVLWRLGLPLFINEFGNLLIIQRLNSAIKNFNGIEMFLNRDFSFIPSIILETPLFGYGFGYFWHFRNNEIVSHNIVIALYVRFGLLGLYLFYYFFIKKIVLLLNSKINEHLNLEKTVLLSLLISLIFEQLKVSFIRYSTTILIYTFLFTIISIFLSLVPNESNRSKYYSTSL